MMLRQLILILLISFAAGCSTYQGVGSEYWHVNRIQEIETAYKNGKLSEKDYLTLKNEVDQTRQEYLLDIAYLRHHSQRVYYGRRW